ncbi:hypothetical protein DFH07DRAFT_75674 [Mycena maculata]|uniref:Uncharacterized protein n=1 Tax=Mycena maculata TaxID=230809 RepID=A0AAD7IC29_9AGAR|nr:hypothetical protein DFH07DRAFT_75674 [Mycena maculata]
MSATEAEHANQTVVESVPVELNVDSPDITTDIVALKETTDIDPKDTDAIQFDLKDASEAGTTQDSIGEIPESLESTEALDGSKIPTIPEKVADTTKDANTTLPSFEGNVDALTGAESEKYGLDEVEVVEEKSHEASHAPLGSAEPVSAEDALTITTEVASTVTPTAGENDATQDVAVADSPAPDPLSFVQEQDVPHVPAAQEENGAAEDSQLASREAEVTFVEEAPNTKVEEDIVRQSDARIKQDASDDLVIEASEDNSMDATAETSFIDSGSVADESLTEIVFAEAEPKAPFEDDLVLQEAQLETADQPSAVDDSTQADAETPVEILSTNPLVVDSVTEITEDQEQSPIETAEAGGLVEGQPLDDTDVSRLLTPREPEVERPKSPWTPSYSVTTQGPGIPASDDLELAELPVLPPPVDVKQLGTNQDDHLETVPVLEQTERTVTVTSVQDVEAEVPPSSEPPRPWTPSYSVVVQGSPLSPPVNLVAQEESTIVGEDNLHSASQDGPNPDIVAPIPDGNPAMVSLINSGIVVDPATLQDPDVEDDSVDPGSEAVVAALIESGVLADDAVAVDQDDSPIATLVSVTTAQDFIDENQAPANPEFSSAPEVQITTDVQATEKMTFDEVPQIETHLTTAQSEPERPRSPWTPSYSVTQHGQISPDGRSESGEVAAPTSKQEMLSAEQQSFIEATRS